MCAFFLVRIYPSALLSGVRFFLMRLYTDALFSGALFSYVLFSSALFSGHQYIIVRMESRESLDFSKNVPFLKV